jgi:hypothetical protein
MNVALSASPASAVRAAGVGLSAAKAGDCGAGLVTLKTSLETRIAALSINLSGPACAERRVARLKRSVWASGHLHGIATKGFRPPQCWFVTLTYKGVSDWCPDHMSKAIQGFRNWCQSKAVACRYTWVGELQKRGAVHYHLLVWLPVGLSMPHWDRMTRKKGGYRLPFWPHGMTNTEKAFSGVGYLMKYLSKLGELTVFPKGIRLYGIGGLDKVASAVRGWFNLPEWAKVSYGVGELMRSKLGLVVRATGEILAPAYSCKLVGGCLEIRQLRPIPEKFHDGAYSSFPRLAS